MGSAWISICLAPLGRDAALYLVGRGRCCVPGEGYHREKTDIFSTLLLVAVLSAG